jgi:hypothetical protein
MPNMLVDSVTAAVASGEDVYKGGGRLSDTAPPGSPDATASLAPLATGEGPTDGAGQCALHRTDAFRRGERCAPGSPVALHGTLPRKHRADAAECAGAFGDARRRRVRRQLVRAGGMTVQQ